MKHVDAVLQWPKGKRYPGPKAFFFAGDSYLRFDVRRDREDYGYPVRISEGWNGLWTARLDTAVLWPREVVVKRRPSILPDEKKWKAYFFRDDEYVRWDIESDSLDSGYPRKIAAGFLGWPPTWRDRVDAALAWNDDTVYFFRDAEYLRYDVVHDVVDQGPRAIEKGWPGVFAEGVDAAVRWRNDDDTLSDKAYFFRDDRYVRYDVKGDRADGPSRRIADGWRGPLPLTVWCNSPDVPSTVCEDARLGGKDGGPAYPGGTKFGQGGWAWGIRFDGFDDLLQKLSGKLPSFLADEPTRPGQIVRLAINAHGYPDTFCIQGVDAFDRFKKETLATSGTGPEAQDYALTPELVKTRSDIRERLKRLRVLLAPNATVLFLGCEAAETDIRHATDPTRSGGASDGLLAALSSILTDCDVVGFHTRGYEARMARVGASCTEAGMRDGPFKGPNMKNPEVRNKWYEDNWDNLTTFPWASADSPHAVTARNGRVVRANKGQYEF